MEVAQSQFFGVVLLCLFVGGVGHAAPIESGKVKWGRGCAATFAAAAESGNPVLIPFQEVPGKSGRQQFGRTVLSDPRLGAVIEADFEPLAVYHNRGGANAEWFKRLGAPASNFQVIRFLDAKGGRNHTLEKIASGKAALADRLVEVLNEINRPVPEVLSLPAQT